MVLQPNRLLWLRLQFPRMNMMAHIRLKPAESWGHMLISPELSEMKNALIQRYRGLALFP